MNGASYEGIQMLQSTNDCLWGVLPFHPVHVIDSSREKLNKNNDFVLLASEGRLSLLSSSGPVSGPNLVQGYSASMKEHYSIGCFQDKIHRILWRTLNGDIKGLTPYDVLLFWPLEDQVPALSHTCHTFADQVHGLELSRHKYQTK